MPGVSGIPIIKLFYHQYNMEYNEDKNLICLLLSGWDVWEHCL